MICLRHILHPIHSVRSLYLRINTHFYKCLAERQFRNIRRWRCDRCWCGGELLPFKWQPSYGVCAECGCYVNRRPPFPEELKRIYSFDLYWHKRAQLKGHPTIECRAANDRSDGRVQYWLDLIERCCKSVGWVVEVGCGSGVLLAELKTRGYKCIGVEPDEKTADWASENMKLDVRQGFFPNVDLPKCDLFLAFDVIEHSPDPKSFMMGVAELLNPGGIAIMQMPIDRYDYQPPFGEMFDAVFDDLEHLYIFTTESINRLQDIAGLLTIAEERWRLAHEIVILSKNVTVP